MLNTYFDKCWVSPTIFFRIPFQTKQITTTLDALVVLTQPGSDKRENGKRLVTALVKTRYVM